MPLPPEDEFFVCKLHEVRLMYFDSEEGIYVFEVRMGIRTGGRRTCSPPFLIQADDADEAEEKVLEYLDDMGIEGSYWVEEISSPFHLETYQQQLEDEEREPYPNLAELDETELQGFLISRIR
ncbi:MAG: hypothetical protein AUK55_10035 [Syntrophobacteraceae bacterium CG2_30_61_12]|nr:MAG: hypothetical protein AUK55_10035 [Syntrophobacteraceae bacterium CG2_30_61_12]